MTGGPALFVGGPWHGTVHKVDDRHHGRVNVPAPPAVPADFLTDRDPRDPGYATYERHRWNVTGSRTILELYATGGGYPDPYLVADALRLLFAKAAEGQTAI